MDEVLIEYLQTIIDDIRAQRLSDEDKKRLGDLIRLYLFTDNEQIPTDLNYFTLGFYIYEFLLKQ